MDLSMRWLNDYVKADMPIKEFVADMTMSGSKVETYHKMSDPINNVVVAKVLKLERHPDSEKLWICQLDAGRDEPVQIVTAAQNLFEGAIVPACMHNSTIADGTKITKGKLRGVVYISCNPATQARDLKTLTKKYTVTDIQPFDMFPHTRHVECVVLLTKAHN